MHQIDGRLLISPRDVIAEHECAHRLRLDWAVVVGKMERPAPVDNPMLEILSNIGLQHEEELTKPRASDGSFILIENEFPTLESYQKSVAATQKAMNEGIEVIAQATLFTGDFIGFVDFLILSRDENGLAVKDPDGRWIYDPVDAKSARSAKPIAILQVSLYAYIMEQIGMPRPRFAHLWLAGDQEWRAGVDDLIADAEECIQRTREKLNQFIEVPNPLWAPPNESCVRCRWVEHCKMGRRDAQDLSLIQNIRMTTRAALIGSGIHSIDDLARATDEQRPRTPKRVSRDTFDNLRAQAHLQVRGRDAEDILYEPRESKYLGLLPEPSLGDVWFDMEGDPFACGGRGLEYMFGVLWRTDQDSSEFDFMTFDASDRDEEGEAFVNFMQWIIARQEQFPTMHIYHYAPYEKTALLKLAQMHGVMERDVNRLVNEGVLVDLYMVTRKSFRFSTPSISLKDVEQVYQGKRLKDQGVVDAVGSMVYFERALIARSMGNQEEFKKILQTIRDYNKVDCESTKELDKWLRDRAADLGIKMGQDISQED